MAPTFKEEDELWGHHKFLKLLRIQMKLIMFKSKEINIRHSFDFRNWSWNNLGHPFAIYCLAKDPWVKKSFKFKGKDVGVFRLRQKRFKREERKKNKWSCCCFMSLTKFPTYRAKVPRWAMSMMETNEEKHFRRMADLNPFLGELDARRRDCRKVN